MKSNKEKVEKILQNKFFKKLDKLQKKYNVTIEATYLVKDNKED